MTQPMPMPRYSRSKPHWALAFYSILSIVLTWPLVRYFTTHVPGDGIDDPSLAWNLWWIKTRLVDQLKLDFFHSDWMFYPIQINLGFYTLTPLNGFLSIPLQTALNLIVASNLLLLSTFIIGALGMFLLSRFLLVQIKTRSGIRDTGYGIQVPFWAALFAGVIYAFASTKLFYASLGQFNIASSHWVPFCILYLLRIEHSNTRRAILHNTSLTALFLIFQAWSELTYASFLLIFIALYFSWQLIIHIIRRPASSTPNTHYPIPTIRSLISPYVLIGLLFVVGISPFLWAMLPDMWVEGDFSTIGGGFAASFSADLKGYLYPTIRHPLFGQWTQTMSFGNNIGQHIYIGYTALILAALGVIAYLRKAHYRPLFWLVSTLLFWLLTLGPQLRWDGRELPIPGLFALVSNLPFFNLNRYPSRYGVMLLVCVAVLVGYGAYWILDSGYGRIRRRAAPEAESRISPTGGQYPFPNIPDQLPWIVGFLMMLFLFEHLSLPLPINNSVVPPIYQRIAEEPGDFSILELPTGWRNGARVLGKSDKLIMMQMWYQAEHGKRRLGGNTSRNPPYKFQYFTEAPLIGDLIDLMNGDQDYVSTEVEAKFDEMIERNRAIAPRILDFLDIQFVVVHVEKSPPALLRFVEDVLPLTHVETWQGVDWSGEPSTIQLYRVASDVTQTGWQIDLASTEGRLHLAEGWATAIDPSKREDVATAGAAPIRFATRSQADLLLDIPTAGGVLELELFGPASQVEIWLNGQKQMDTPISDLQTDRWVVLQIPQDVANRAIDRLSLNFAGAMTPIQSVSASSGVQGWSIGATGVSIDPATSIVVHSAGLDVGNFAHIYVNGKDVTGNQRGYHLAVLTPDGEVLATQVFDTHLHPENSQKMAIWLQQWPDGTIISGAVQDEASLNLGQDAVEALTRLGVVTNLQGKERWSHAFIGVVGTPDGFALEQTSLLEPASVFVGVPVESPFVSGGVGQIKFTSP